MLDSVRYFLGVLLLVGLPPGLFLWFAIHPFAKRWRKLGAGRTYGILSVPVAAQMAGLIVFRDSLLGTDLGANPPLMVMALVCVAGAVTIGIKRKKYLTFRILAGIPELSRDAGGGKLLSEGIYSRIRHPRYVEAVLAVLGYALFANYVGLYLLFGSCLVAMYFIVLLEERELRDRFGNEYDE